MEKESISKSGVRSDPGSMLEILHDAAEHVRTEIPEMARSSFEILYREVMEQARADISLALALSAAPHSSVEYFSTKQEYISSYAYDTKSTIEMAGENIIKYRVFDSIERPIPSGPFILVFMPVRNGKDRVLSSVLQLQKEMNTLAKNGVQNELHICLNSSTDGTRELLMQNRHLLSEIAIAFYEIDLPELRYAGQIAALQMLYSLHARRDGWKENEELFIHVADDDIGYPEHGEGILRNISALRKNPDLRATSGTYTYDKEATGFHFLNSIRRDPNIILPLNPFPTLYGGALTLRARYFPTEKLPENTSFDVYLVLRELQAALQRGTSFHELLYDHNKLPILTNPSFGVRHMEEPHFHTFIWRLLRDSAWRKNAAEALGDSHIEELFLQLRKKYFDAVTQKFASLPPEDNRMLGQLWMRAIRDRIYELQKSIGLNEDDLSEIAKVRRFPSAYSFASNLVNDPKRLQDSLCYLNGQKLLLVEDTEDKDSPMLSEKKRFKLLERSIRVNLVRKDFSVTGLPPDIVALGEYIKRTDATRDMFRDPHSVRTILRWAGIHCNGDIDIEPVAGGRVNLSFFITANDNRFFIKYFDPFGTEFMQKQEPCRAVFRSILTEKIYAEIIGSDHVVRSLYPDVDTAILNAFGQEGVHPMEHILQRILLQPDISMSHAPLEDRDALGISENKKAEIFAHTVATLHGRSLGIGQASSYSTELARLMQIGKREIRTSTPEEFSRWLREKNWIFQALRKQLQSTDSANPIFCPVLQSLEENGIAMHALIDGFIFSSEKRHKECACIGHFDLSPQHIFVRKNDWNDYVIIDIDSLGFVDPVYEAGHSIYSLLWRRIRNDASVTSDELIDTAQIFLDTYLFALHETTPSDSFKGHAQLPNRRELERDISTFAGMTLLRVGSEDYRKEGLSPEQIAVTNDVITALCSEHNK